MTLVVDIDWTCKCGHKNRAQLWHTDCDLDDGAYENGSVPKQCELNRRDSCRACGLYTLSEEPHSTGGDTVGFDVVPVAALDDASRLS